MAAKTIKDIMLDNFAARFQTDAICLFSVKNKPEQALSEKRCFNRQNENNFTGFQLASLTRCVDR